MILLLPFFFLFSPTHPSSLPPFLVLSLLCLPPLLPPSLSLPSNLPSDSLPFLPLLPLPPSLPTFLPSDHSPSIPPPPPPPPPLSLFFSSCNKFCDPRELDIMDEVEYCIVRKSNRLAADEIKKLPRGTIITEQVLHSQHHSHTLSHSVYNQPLNSHAHAMMAISFSVNSIHI